MRWDFLEPPTPEDVIAGAQVHDAIARWWTTFAEHEAAIVASFRRDGPPFDLPRFMAEHLHAVHPKLMWEFGPPWRGTGHRLVVTPEHRRTLRPLTRALLRAAPALEGWEFFEYRLPDPESVESMVRARVKLDLEEHPLRGLAALGGSHHIHLTVAADGVHDVDRLRHATFVALETLLGEELLDTWIGAVEAVEPPALEGAQGKPWTGLTGLKQAIERLKAAALTSLADRPWFEADLDQVGFEGYRLRAPPGQASNDEDAPERDDVLAGSSCVPTLVRSLGRSFSSARASRFDETFCYLKLERRPEIPGVVHPDREELENALDAELRPKRLGATIGGATGRRYTYIDLALSDVRGAIPRIQAALRAADVPIRSWLLFFDDVWRDEWVGVWPDTPPPPRRAEA